MSTSLTLTDDEKHRLRMLMRRAELHPKVRERAEAVLLLAQGWSTAEVAAHVERCGRTVKRWLQCYASGGDAGLAPQRPGPPRVDRSALDEALRALLAQPRTWTLRQLGEALAAQGTPTSRNQVRASLARLGARWVRTHHSLSHRQDAAAVEAAREQLEELKKGL